MTVERLDALFGSPIISHLLVFTDAEHGGKSVWRRCISKARNSRITTMPFTI